MSRIVTVGLLALSSGCTEKLGERAGVGLTIREMKGGYRGFKAKTLMPVVETRIKKKLADDLDVYARNQFSAGEVEAQHEVLEGESRGNFASLGSGLNYFPFNTRLIGLDVGAEIYRAEYRMRGWYGPFSQVTADRFWGGGVNLGLMGEIPLNKQRRWCFVWGTSYNFTATDAKKATVDLDDWSWTVVIQIDLYP